LQLLKDPEARPLLCLYEFIRLARHTLTPFFPLQARSDTLVSLLDEVFPPRRRCCAR
jgi:hypothetical protein